MYPGELDTLITLYTLAVHSRDSDERDSEGWTAAALWPADPMAMVGCGPVLTKPLRLE